MGHKRGSSPVNTLFAWVRRQSMKVKAGMAAVAALALLVALKHSIEDHNHFFVASEVIHFAGILVLIYKLIRKKSCSGLSLRTQEITALFLAIRLCCSFSMEADIHTMLDFVTLLSTLWVMYMIRFKLKFTYMAELDSMPIYYIIVPAAILAVFVHPYTTHVLTLRMMWAFCVFLESVSVLPQLRMMQKAKMIEPFTAHYVFALGIARFLGCAHWIIRMYETRGGYLYLVGRGYLWIPTVFLSEMVQTFILADFCYYYVKSAVNGQLLITLQSPV
ncbi:PREDICTED: putative ER lumen protein-retaining receptor C28H8.4 [Ipomoea nil]|uniref:putative ER lumen protein-retaining receptor C28H8.4 n=1 Tax=Ipomoea nil TaxID=35883 RepID=UPI000900DCE5|nr:PREDICTED: putative ER lumen protein-retaining receptor C28H8.4 [Ipomoea nil]